MKFSSLPSCLTICLALAMTASVQAAEMFSLSVGDQDNLIISTPQGAPVSQLPPGTIQQPVKVGSTSFVVSYGQDTRKQYSAILAPDPDQPKAVEFSVAGNRVYADSKASVTVTFSPNKKSVSVDPGAFGTVTLNGNRLNSTVAAKSQGTSSNPIDLSSKSEPKPSATNSVASKTRSEPAPSTTTASSEPVTMASTNGASSNGASTNGASTTGAARNGASIASGASPSMAGSTASRLLTSAMTMTPNSVRFWAEPITPPSGRLPSVANNQMKLLEVRGPVTVKLPSGRTERAKNGMIIPSGSSVRTTSGSSAAVFIGGVNSARLTENSTAKFNHNYSENTQRTTVDLTRGCVFSKVGRKSGQQQDYKVRTPVGIAAAKGTDYATLYRDGNMYVFIVGGRVFLFDLAGNLLGSGSPNSAGQVTIISTANLDDEQMDGLLNEIVDIANENNSKINDILAKMAQGIPLSDEEQNYLASVPTIGREESYNNDWEDTYNPYWGYYGYNIQIAGTYNPTDDYDPVYDILNQPTLAPDSIYDQPTGPNPTTPF